jgi:hypothetical protein
MTAVGYASTTGDTRKVAKAGDTMTGELMLPDSSPDTALTAASKGYVDTVAAAKAALAGAHFTGDVTVDGYTTLEGGQFNSGFAAFGSMTLIGTGKRVRFRPDGGDIDVEGGGRDAYFSVWTGADFTGTQHTYLRLESGAAIAHAVGTWVFSDSPFGGGHTLSGSTLGFFGAAPASKPTVSGSKGGNAALGSLITALAALGLITDGTS